MSKDPSSAELRIGDLEVRLEAAEQALQAALDREAGTSDALDAALADIEDAEARAVAAETALAEANRSWALRLKYGNDCEDALEAAERRASDALSILGGIDYEEGSRIDQAVRALEADA